MCHLVLWPLTECLPLIYILQYMLNIIHSFNTHPISVKMQSFEADSKLTTSDMGMMIKLILQQFLRITYLFRRGIWFLFISNAQFKTISCDLFLKQMKTFCLSGKRVCFHNLQGWMPTNYFFEGKKMYIDIIYPYVLCD